MNLWKFISLVTSLLILCTTNMVSTVPTDDDLAVGYHERQVEEFLKLIANQSEGGQGNRDNSNITRYDHCVGESIDCPKDEICCCMEIKGYNFGCTCLYQILTAAFPLATCDWPDDLEEEIGGGGWGWRENDNLKQN